MDLNKYDELRKKIQTKDFEGKNKSLDVWLYRLSFLGNIGSIFFAYFLVSPALEKAILVNLISGNVGVFIAIVATIILLISFEIIKRLLIKNLSFDLVKNKFNVLKATILTWFIFSVGIIGISVFLSVNGAMNFAQTNNKTKEIMINNLQMQIDSIKILYDNKKEDYILENQDLREANNGLRNKLIETPLNYISARNDYQKIIDKNIEIIDNNEKKINNIDSELKSEITNVKNDYNSLSKENNEEESKNILLFILISASIEILIIIGVFFREFYEYNLYILNQNKLEKVYKKRDRYKAMLAYIYQEGKANHGDRVIAASKLIDLVTENSTITNPKKFVENFLRDMESLNVFVVQGKRRLINTSYEDALKYIDNFDDALRILENLR
ncbi:MAG: hypothetical protein ACOC33_01065 [bacterium]